MSELGFERQPLVSHSELTPGHDVTHLLSTINQTHSIKQSKADQILRLLHDQDKLNDQVGEIEDIDLEYNQIREEKVICDSDTLTDSSSDGETEVTIAEPEEVLECDDVTISNKNNQRSKEGRSKTSIGFYGFERNDSGIHLEHESDNMGDRGGWFDTRDLSVRPKSSYVRRGQLYRKNTEVNLNSPAKTVDRSEEITHRSVSASAKNRPKSRLGRDSVRLEKKIELVETTVDVQPEVPKEDVVSKAGATGSLYKRFERTRTPLPRRGSKRTKGFCEDSNSIPNTGVSTENTRAPHNVHPVYSDMETSVKDMSGMQAPSNNVSSVTRTPVQTLSNTTVPRNSPVLSYQHRQNPTSPPSRADTSTRNQHDNHVVEQQQQQQQHHQQQHQQQQHQQQQHVQTSGYANIHQQQVYQQHQLQQHQQQHQQQHIQAPSYANIHRSDTVLTVASSIRQDTANGTNTLPVKRTQSNSNSSYRPKNPEPISTRPMGRPDVRPATRQRRLTRRYMQQSQASTSSVRPTSESVILARQKTEKNLLKKQSDNRPQSEKIPVSNKNILSVSNNPTQGPQTNINMSKEGLTQSSHVGAGGFRGYDPGHRLKSSSRPRDIPADLTLPRSGMFGARKNLAALMKLPPLEESLAAKKKERGLALAQRETCV